MFSTPGYKVSQETSRNASLFIKVLRHCAFAITCCIALAATHAQAKLGPAEKEDVKFGFIKLTDMVPLAVAYELGYFDDEGLSVQLEAQANWKVLLDRVITGELDGAHMLAGQMLAQNPGLGKFVWDEFQNGSSDSLGRICVAVLIIGFIGFILDRSLLTLQSWVNWDKSAVIR